MVPKLREGPLPELVPSGDERLIDVHAVLLLWAGLSGYHVLNRSRTGAESGSAVFVLARPRIVLRGSCAIKDALRIFHAKRALTAWREGRIAGAAELTMR